MPLSGVVIALDPNRSNRARPDARRRARHAPRPLAAIVADAALAAGLTDVVVVTNTEELAAAMPDGVTVLLDESVESTESSALRAAVDFCARSGADSVVVALIPAAGKDAALDAGLWRGVANATTGPVVIGTRGGRRTGPVRIDARAWPLLPLAGPVEAMWRSRPDLVHEVGGDLAPAPPADAADEMREDAPGVADDDRWFATDDDVRAVEALLGRRPAGRFSVAVRDRDGGPVVIANAPFLDDGTPMPTLFWLVGRAECDAVGRLEAAGGVRRAEAAIAPELIEAAHGRYAARRDALVPADHRGPRPTGGVGGTRVGVKCLHAHLAGYLAGTGDPVGRWVVAELGSALDGPVAAIDCGTNSTRLLVVDRSGQTLERVMRITRLGEDVDRTGRLTSGAIERTLAVLAEYRSILDHFGVVRVRATATSAARDASNANELFEPARAVLGIELELLAGTEEGRLSYLGATAELDPLLAPFLVVDLGGGSTELVAPMHDSAEKVDAISLDVGCVRVTERFLESDPPTSGQIVAARDYVSGLVEDALATHPALGAAATLVGVAGTVATLVLLDAGLRQYSRDAVHHQRIARSRVAELAEQLLAESSAARALRPGIEAGRADVIAAGALVLAVIMDRTGHEQLIASESDILDGMTETLRADPAR